MNLPASSAPTTPLNTSEVAHLLAAGHWTQLASALGYTPCNLTIPHEAFEIWGFPTAEHPTLDHVELLSATPGFRLLMAHVEDAAISQPTNTTWASCRRIMLALHRKNPADLTLWWWIRETDITVALVAEDATGRTFIRRMLTNRHAPDAVSLQQWLHLNAENLPAPDTNDALFGLRRHLNDVLSQDGLTREFFQGFTRALELLKNSMRNGPVSDQERHDISLSTLLRLVFMYFLQSRRALDHDPNFIIRQLRKTRAQQSSFYQNILRPLFFGALNRPCTERTPTALQLGAIPFLNGGLFEPLPAETRHQNLDWPPETWHAVIDSLLERYHFTIDTESCENGDECRSIEPEMLGKVFEGLMYGDARARTGSFYTPRDVVRTMVESALIGYLTDDAQITQSQAESIVQDRANSATQILPDQQAITRIEASLRRVRLLDPAVGTGAFLLEALQTLKRCWHNLGRAPHTQNACETTYAWTRQLIHDHLFGVDITSTAVRLCELRLWLAILPSMPGNAPEDMPPLPNLSHRIATGNALLSPHDLVSLKSGPASRAAFPQTAPLRKLRQKLAHLQHQYLTAHGPKKSSLQHKIRTTHKQLHIEMLTARSHALDDHLRPFQKLQQSHDLFGAPLQLTADQRATREHLEQEKQAITRAIDDLHHNRTDPMAFCFESSFGADFDREGFDIIITNPPWVRAHRIDRSLQKPLRARYTCTDSTLWSGAAELGITNQFGTQADLSALFLERSLELLRPGGRLCALIPVKLFRSLHGSRLRTLLNQHEIIAIEDFSEADRTMFDATTYPAILHVRKSLSTTPQPPPPTPISIHIWRQNQRSTWQSTPQNLWTLGHDPGEPWMLVEPEIRRIFDDMRQHACALGTVAELLPHRGILTGANDIFIKSPAQLRAIFGNHFDDLFHAYTRPVLCGREIRANQITPTRHILWPFDESMHLHPTLPAPLEAYFESHRSKLQNRSDFKTDAPLWQIFRATQALQHPRVVWRDMSIELEAAVSPAHYIPLNTVYFIPCADEQRARALATLLNSEPIRAIAFAIAERARGGWRRHFAWVMRMLPIPQPFIDWLQNPNPPEISPATITSFFHLDDHDLTRIHAWRNAHSHSALHETYTARAAS